jgi:hypothetical protein
VFAVEAGVKVFRDVDQLVHPDPARQNGHVGDETDVLHQRGALAGGILAENGQFSVVRGQPQDGLERGGLAGSVGADQAHYAPGRNVEVDVVDRDHAPVTLGESVC